MANIKTQFLISKEIKNHELFLKKNRAQATSLKLQATGGRVGPKRYKHQGWVGP
jgi:hypothetical protein